MHSSRRVAAAAVGLSLAFGGGITVAHADGGTTIYVNESAKTCTDSGDGSLNAPYCTIQAAADAAVAGDTVDILGGRYQGPLTISAQGTPNEPIAFRSVGYTVQLWMPPGDTAPGLLVNGASHVSFDGLNGAHGPRLLVSYAGVENSTGVSLEGINGDSIAVAGSADDVTVEDNEFGAGPAIAIGSGSSGDTVSGNYLVSGDGSISVTGVKNTAITSNTIMGDNAPAPAISVSGASTGVSVENNIATYPGLLTPAEISVDKTSAAGTAEDYNVLWPSGGVGATTIAAYSWAGKDYSSQSAFSKATGQGKHDIVADPELNDGDFSGFGSAPQLNSGNYYAPGLPSTDLYGDPISTDPAVAVPSPGVPAVDRGAVQAVYTDGVSATASPTALNASLDSALTQALDYQGEELGVVPAPTPAVTYTVNWGDGVIKTYGASSTAADTILTHSYAKPGTYKITDTAHLTNGKTVSSTTSVTATR